MKTRLFILAGIACVFLGCSSDKGKDINKPHKILEGRDYAEFMVGNYPEVFGCVLILDSIGEAYQLLNQWESAPYHDIRDDYSSLGYSNDIVESHIVYDSLICKNMDLYNITDFSVNNQREEEMFQELYHVISSNFSDLIVPKRVYENELEDTINIIEPLGDLDLCALTNEYGIFIADTIVYKLFPNGKFLAVPISMYPMYAREDYEHLLDIINQENNCIPDLEYVYIYDHYRGEPLYQTYSKVKYDHDYKYRLEVSLKAFANYSWFYGTTTLGSELKVKNYKLGCFGWFYWRIKLHASGSYQYIYEAYRQTNPHDVQENYYSYIDGVYSCRTYRNIVARFADHYFPYPEYGFIGAGWSITNGNVENEIH